MTTSFFKSGNSFSVGFNCRYCDGHSFFNYFYIDLEIYLANCLVGNSALAKYESPGRGNHASFIVVMKMKFNVNFEIYHEI